MRRNWRRIKRVAATALVLAVSLTSIALTATIVVGVARRYDGEELRASSAPASRPSEALLVRAR